MEDPADDGNIVTWGRADYGEDSRPGAVRVAKSSALFRTRFAFVPWKDSDSPWVL